MEDHINDVKAYLSAYELDKIPALNKILRQMTKEELKDLQTRFDNYAQVKLQINESNRHISEYFVNQIYVHKWKRKIIELLKDHDLYNKQVQSYMNKFKSHTKLELIYDSLNKSLSRNNVYQLANNILKLDFATFDSNANSGIKRERIKSNYKNTPLYLFINDLKIEKLMYYAKSFEKVRDVLRGEIFDLLRLYNKFNDNRKKVFPTYIKQLIDEKVGLCHLSNKLSNNMSVNNKFFITKSYVEQLIGQMYYIADNYIEAKNRYKYKRTQNIFRKTFMKKYSKKLGGRPCLDNMLEEGVNMFLEKDFIWKGKNINRPLMLYNNNSQEIYLHEILIPALQSFHETEKINPEFKKLNLNQRKKYFWNFIKDRPIFTINNDGLPVYTNLKYFDKNGIIMQSLMENNGYLNLLDINTNE